MTVERSSARERLLLAASELFYREGIHAVGVDRIIAQAGVTRATFYRHYPSKEDLVEAYLGLEDDRIRAAFAQAGAAAGDDPVGLLRALIAGLSDDVARNHTRGCPFINAAAEYPHADSGVRRTIDRHRSWFRAQLVFALAAAGTTDDPSRAAGELVLLRDAAMVGGYLDGWERVEPAFTSAAERAVGLA